MKRAHILGALVGVESVTDAGLKDVYKGFNLSGEELVARLKAFRRHGVHVLGSFIFGLPSDREDTFAATVALAQRADLTFAQFVLLTPFPGTIDFEKWAAEPGRQDVQGRRRAGHPALADSRLTASQALHRASDDVARGDSQPDAGRLGSVLQLEQHLAAIGAWSSRCAIVWRSCWCRSCIARCTPIPASPPTARAWRVRRAGRVSSDRSAGVCSWPRRCPTCRCPRVAASAKRHRPVAACHSPD